MSSLITTTYQDTVILFQPDAYINATQIANKFNKKVKDYLKTDQTKEYIAALARFSKGTKILFDENQLVKVKKGSSANGGGTWLHPKLAIYFARWLNPDFAVWCDMQIENILHPVRNALVILPKLTPRQQRHIQGVVKKLVNTQVGSTYAIVWGSVKKEFDVGTYKDIPEAKYPDLCKFLKCKPLEGELLPKEVIPAYNYPLDTVKPADMIGNNAWLTADNLLNKESGHPVEDLLTQLEKDNFNIEGCKTEYNGLKYCLANYHSALEELKHKTDSIRRQMENAKGDFGCLQRGEKLWFGE